MNEKVSVIIPVYNAKAYLENCVASLTGQTYENLEILLVDDGSSDGSLELCNRLAQEDGRIRVLHHENSGPSATRNRGIAEAQGEYITFVDSDDWMEKGAIQSMVEAADEEGAELIIGAYGRFQDGENTDCSVYRLTTYSKAVLEGMQDMASLFACAKTSLAGVSVWAKLYRTELIRQHQVAFPVEVNYEEDCCFNLQYYRYVKRAIALRDVVYHYRQTPLSLSKVYRPGNLYHLLNGYRKRCAFFEEAGVGEKIPALKTIMLIVFESIYKKIVFSNLNMRQKKDAYASVVHHPEVQQILEDAMPPEGRLIGLITAAAKSKNVWAISVLMNVWKLKQRLKKSKV